MHRCFQAKVFDYIQRLSVLKVDVEEDADSNGEHESRQEDSSRVRMERVDLYLKAIEVRLLHCTDSKSDTRAGVHSIR